MSPDAAVPQGYLPPPSAYEAVTEFTLGDDPLVADSHGGIGGWFAKWAEVLRRSGTRLTALFAITVFLPSLLLGLLTVLSHDLALIAAVSLTGGIGASLALMLGMATAVHLTTRQAAGLPAGLGESLHYGVRRFAGLTGWMFVAALGFLIPTVMVLGCGQILGPFAVVLVVPIALYLSALIAFVGPVYLFERGNVIARSFELLHGAFWRTAGRLLIVGAVYAAIAGVQSPMLGAAARLDEPALEMVALLAASVFAAGLDLVATVLLFSGVLVTYAERRGDEGLLTHDLVRELTGHAPGARA